MIALFRRFRAEFGTRRLMIELYYGFWLSVAFGIALTGAAVVL